MKTLKSARTRYLKVCLLALATGVGATTAIAEATTASKAIDADAKNAALQLNGIAPYINLGTEYYIGALYLQEPQSAADAVIFTPSHKRMVMLVTVEKFDLHVDSVLSNTIYGKEDGFKL